MTFAEIRQITDETQQIQKTYELFCEKTRLNPVPGNAPDLSRSEERSFDAVLLFGPLYHLHSLEDQKKCIAEAKRVCKPDGTLFFAFITNDMVLLTEFMNPPDHYLIGECDKENLRREDSSLVPRLAPWIFS